MSWGKDEKVKVELTKRQFVALEDNIRAFESGGIVEINTGSVMVSVSKKILWNKYIKKLEKAIESIVKVKGDPYKKCYGDLNLVETKHLWRVLMIADIRFQREKINKRFSL